MQSSKTPTVVSSGKLEIGGQSFMVHVLNDGRRVFEKDDFERLIKLFFTSDKQNISQEEVLTLVKAIKGV